MLAHRCGEETPPSRFCLWDQRKGEKNKEKCRKLKNCSCQLFYQIQYNLDEPNQKVNFGWKSVAFPSLLSLVLTHHWKILSPLKKGMFLVAMAALFLPLVIDSQTDRPSSLEERVKQDTSRPCSRPLWPTLANLTTLTTSSFLTFLASLKKCSKLWCKGSFAILYETWISSASVSSC